MEADIINALEGTYHQGGQTVDNYLDNFQVLVSDASYMDLQMLVVKFRRGLRLEIQNQITTMPYGQLANTDPDVWYRAVWRIDQARLANEVFQSILYSAPSAPPKTISTWPPPLFVVRLPPILPFPVTPKPPPPALSMGIPIDVDVTMLQTSFSHISINSLTILTVLMAIESPWKDLLIDTSHVSKRLVLAKILGRSTSNHHGTVY